MDTSPQAPLDNHRLSGYNKKQEGRFPWLLQGSRPTCQVFSLKLPLLAMAGGRLFLYLVAQRNSRNHERK